MYKQVGDYELKTRIGRGNYADVYLGVHQRSKEQYAIKVIAKEKFSHPKLIAGLESEVKIMKEFNHRNILSLKKYFSSANNFYLVMEYCAGGDLNKFIRKIGKLREEHAFNFLTQLAEGIAFLNEHGFIHRDLKTANVLLSEESVRATLKIADFGFARHLQTDALAQTPCGTPLYMAPEVLSAGQYDAKADIWSIGCIFYEMLSGQSPFTGLNEADLLNNIRTKELRAPPDVSSVSVSILKRLLEKNIASRASIQDLLQVCHHITRLSQSQVAQQASTSPSLSHSQTKTVAVAATTALDPNSTTNPNASSDSKINNNNDTNNNFDLDIDEDDEEPPLQTSIAAPATAEKTVLPPTTPTAAIPKANSQQDFNNANDAPSINNVANNINNKTNNNHNNNKNKNNMSNYVSVLTKPSLQLPMDTVPTPTPTTGNPLPTTKANDNSTFYEDYELVDNANLSTTNSKLQLKITTKQPSTQSQKSQLAGTLSPIPPTPSYVPINASTNTATSGNTNYTNMKSVTPAIFKTVSSDNTDVASNNSQPTGPNYPSHPVHPQQQSYSWFQQNLLQVTQHNTNLNSNNHNNNNNANSSSNNAMLGGSSTMYQYQDLYQKNMLQRWEVLGPLVLVITQVADHWIRQDMFQHNSNSNSTNNNTNDAMNSNNAEDKTTIEDSPFTLPPANSTTSNANEKVSGYVVESAEQVAVLLKALALYLHALSLVKTFLLAMDISDETANTNANTATGVVNDTDLGWLVLSRLRQDVVLLFSHLTARAEQSTFYLSQCTAGVHSNSNTVNIHNNSVPQSQWKATMPKAEALMLQEALLQEQEAEMEELLGKLDRAQKLYEAARHLLVGVLLTFAEENVDLRKQVTFSLKNVVDVLEQKILSCKERWQVMRHEFEPLDE